MARRNPDILARVQERLLDDPRIDVISDRRHRERRQATAAHAPERRGSDRRRPTNVWNDLTIYPTLVAQRHVDSYAELERKAGSAAADNELLREYVGDRERRIDALIAGDEQLRAENGRLREEIVELQRRLGALAAADAAFKADVAALLAQADEVLGGLITNFRRLTPEGRRRARSPTSAVSELPRYGPHRRDRPARVRTRANVRRCRHPGAADTPAIDILDPAHGGDAGGAPADARINTAA